ncbi:MAG: hypothetical protein HQL21_04405 [Candidatus Omnitrophica bacterium]|nr:hypothetical protein [Candidatus Omnitrophota bacterium]
MFRKLRNKKAQNTAEYAILIALVIGAVVAMQTYAQRALQGRIRDASVYMKDQTSGLGGSTGQYEPYYLCSKSETQRNSQDKFTETGSTTKSQSETLEKEDITLGAQD